MALTWGAMNNHLRVGIDVTQAPATVTSDTVSVTLTVKKYVGNDSIGWDFNDDQTMTHTGNITGTTNFHNSLTAVNASQLVHSYGLVVTLTGATQAKTFGASISGAYNGATPSHSVGWTVPARPSPPVVGPPTPATPTVLAVNYGGAYLNVVEPGGGAYSVLEYQQQTATSTAFTTIVDDTLFPDAGTVLVKNCNPTTPYWTRVRARNANGWSSYSGSATFTTVAKPAGNVFFAKVDGIWRMVTDDYYKTAVKWDDISEADVKVSSAWDV